MKVSIRLDGLADLDAALKELEKRSTAKNVGRRALRAGAEVIREEAVNLAPDAAASGPGKYLRESIKVGNRQMSRENRAFMRGAGRDQVEVFVGIDGSVKPPEEPKTDARRRRSGGGSSGGSVAFYSMAQEFGLGSTPAQPYMRPAFEAKKDQAVKVITEALRKEIDKAKDRAARKAARLAAKG